MACETRQKYVDVNAAVSGSVRDLRHRSLTEEQKLVIANFLRGNEAFVALPTAYGKKECQKVV